jgi:Na+/proline symporter
VRDVATAFFLMSRLAWMATMLYSASLVLSMMFGWTRANGFANGQLWGISAIGALATTFALIGGMHAVIWTDVMQFFVLLSGLLTMLVLGTSLSGGIGEVIRIGSHFGRFAAPPVFSLTQDLSIVSGLLLGFVGMLASSGADQVILQQYLTAKSESEAKASLWRNGFLLKPMSLVYPLLGLSFFAFYQTHPDVARLMRIPDDALPVFVVNVLPNGWRGLVMSGVIAAVLTSMQSGLAAISATAQVNYLKRWIGRPLSDSESVLLARILLFSSGLTVIALACWVRALGERHSIIQILNIVMYPFAGVLLGIFLLGILTHRANGPGALIGAIGGFLGTVAIPAVKLLLPSSLRIPALQQLGEVSNFYYGLIGTLLTVTVGYAVSLLSAPPPESRIKGLTRWSLPVATKSELAAKVG